MLAHSHQTSDFGYSTSHFSTFQSATARTSSMPLGRHRQPELSGRRPEKFAKKVHWASNVRDNDNKYSIRPRSMVRKSRSPSMKPSSSSPSRPPTQSNSSAKIVREHVREDSEDFTSPAPPNMSRMVDPVHWRASNEAIPKRRSGTLSSNTDFEHHVISLKTSTRSRGHRTKDSKGGGGDSEVGASANSSHRRSSSSVKKHSSRVTQLLPRVPDAPRFDRPVPATPRLARLPTPSLDDLSDRDFCSCDSSMCRDHFDVQDSWDGAFTSKMSAQLQAAQEYIKSRSS